MSANATKPKNDDKDDSCYYYDEKGEEDKNATSLKPDEKDDEDDSYYYDEKGEEDKPDKNATQRTNGTTNKSRTAFIPGVNITLTGDLAALSAPLRC